MTEKDRGAVRSLTKRNLLWTLMGHGPQTCLNLSYRHWSVVAPHCPGRDPWDWMHVANSGCRVCPDSHAHWHVSALLPIRKLCSSPHRQCRHRRHPRRIRFQANAGGQSGAPGGSSRRRCSGCAMGNLEWQWCLVISWLLYIKHRQKRLLCIKTANQNVQMLLFR